MATAINTAMMAITIINSISVKPKRRRFSAGEFIESLPLRVRSTILRLIPALGVNIENILPAPGQRLGIVTRAAQSPVFGIGHGVLRDFPQISDLFVHRPSSLDAFHQLLQGFRI